MRTFTMPIAAATSLLLAACAAAPGDTTMSANAGCAAGEPRIGTLVVRKESCAPMTAEEREAARRQVEAMQAEQERVRNNSRKGN